MTIARCSRLSMILLTINMNSPITITSLTTVRDHGRDETTFVEGSATFVCDGLLNGWDGTSAKISCGRVVRDEILFSNFGG